MIFLRIVLFAMSVIIINSNTHAQASPFIDKLINKWKVDSIYVNGLYTQLSDDNINSTLTFKKNNISESENSDSEVSKGIWKYDPKKEEITILNEKKELLILKVISIGKCRFVFLLCNSSIKDEIAMYMSPVADAK